jgi:hypothetical protein
MNLAEPPPVKPSDDLDGLLRAFFRSQMPQPWPTPRLSFFRAAPAEQQPASGRTLRRSRWALAAAVGLLLLGSLLLPGRLASDRKTENAPGGPMTSDNELRRSMEQEHKNRHVPPKPKPGLEGDVRGSIPELKDF